MGKLGRLQDIPGTSMLSQKLLLKILSMVRTPVLSSDGLGAMVGGNVDMSATGPISLSNWNSFNRYEGSCPKLCVC